MAKKLVFRYGCMNSGKSLMLAAVAFNYRERGQRVIVIKPTVDTKDANVVSRVGINLKVDWAPSKDDFLVDYYERDLETSAEKIACILVDEAQFLTPDQVDELLMFSTVEDIPVLAYGLRTDFKTQAFPGAARLLEVAHNIEELKTICRCGSKALFNARKINGAFVNEGESVAIDGVEAEYESLCAKCYLDQVVPIAAS